MTNIDSAAEVIGRHIDPLGDTDPRIGDPRRIAQAPADATPPLLMPDGCTIEYGVHDPHGTLIPIDPDHIWGDDEAPLWADYHSACAIWDSHGGDDEGYTLVRHKVTDHE